MQAIQEVRLYKREELSASVLLFFLLLSFESANYYHSFTDIFWELLGKEDIKYRAFTRALGVMRDNGEIDIVKPGVYKIKAFAVEYF